jgi:uncharacterized protein (TIGR03066 family)
MSAWRLRAASVLAIGLLGAVRAEEKKPDNKTLIVGVWELTKGTGGPPVGAILTFDKEGKVKMTAKMDGQEVTREGAYAVDGDKVKVTAEGRTESATIKKLTEKELILEAEQGRTMEFMRKK